jgi:oligoribonuclease
MKHTLCWIDLEMTGLDLNTETIIEIAAIITDDNLNPINEGINIVIHCPKERLDQMGEWPTNQHGKSGLTQECINSTINLAQAEKKILTYIKKHCKKKKTLLCGNCIWIDRAFIHKEMPTLYDFFSYRVIDVTSIKELAFRWNSSIPEFEKKENHRALEDCKESMAELKYLREKVFKQ